MSAACLPPAALTRTAPRACSPIKYHRKKDRSGLTFEDPFPGLEHRSLDVNGVR